ncbi:hypothetical protein F0U60_44980 [Archangium minus]|uniref:GTPase-associated system helical domain-containing protein n=1 Tax=Archangium minus TaxID=83450 RepID=A0ABY9X521_9BACT|nr:hypothetical protein F0U60_44980 [Archangium minus]
MDEGHVVAMNPDFPRWYRTVSLGDDRDRVQRRWAGVLALADQTTRDDVEAMLRIIFRAKLGPLPAALARLRQPFKDADELFDMQGNSRELEILCGAGLVTLFNKNVDISAIAALSVTTTALGGARAIDLPQDLLVQAENALAKTADRNRERPNLREFAVSGAPNTDFDKAVIKVRQQPDFNSVAAAFTSIDEVVRDALKKSAESILAVNKFITAQDEELQMLWWLVGERSWDYDCAFSAVSPEAQPLLFAKELSQLTNFFPGPRSVKALLSRAGLKDRKKLTVPAAVNECDPTWLAQLVDGVDVSPISQPIHFAIRRKLETGDKESWIAGWAAAAGIDAGHTLPALTLGSLFYRERLLARISEE